MTGQSSLKEQVKDFWEREPCGVRYGSSTDPRLYFEELERKRYELEPFIPDFAGFADSKERRILEIGVGTGVDFRRWIEAGARPVGIDITTKAVQFTRRNLEVHETSGERYALFVADAEKLPFRSLSFDMVYSWGVLHHTPNTEAAFREVFRVLVPGGTVKAMVYHVPSWTGLLLWLRHGLFAGKPLKSMRKIMSHHLESPGTKAYRPDEMCHMLASVGFKAISAKTVLSPTDSLRIELSSKYDAAFYRIIKRIYPRWLVEAVGGNYGLLLLIEAAK